MFTPDQIIALTTHHQAFPDSISWRLTPLGLETPQGIETWGGEPKTCRRFWTAYGDQVRTWSAAFGVPAELIVACALTETNGNPQSVREEPGYASDEVTPMKVSAGLMQLLIGTAGELMAGQGIHVDRAWLLDPGNSLRAGTMFIASQRPKTNLDPPKVACAYNAGGVYHQGGEKNRWKMRQFPIGTGEHADRYVKWFNETMLMFRTDGGAPEGSFTALLGA